MTRSTNSTHLFIANFVTIKLALSYRCHIPSWKHRLDISFKLIDWKCFCKRHLLFLQLLYYFYILQYLPSLQSDRLTKKGKEKGITYLHMYISEKMKAKFPCLTDVDRYTCCCASKLYHHSTPFARSWAKSILLSATMTKTTTRWSPPAVMLFS